MTSSGCGSDEEVAVLLEVDEEEVAETREAVPEPEAPEDEEEALAGATMVEVEEDGGGGGA